MSYLKHVFVVYFIANSLSAETFIDEYDNVAASLKSAETYVLPTNNEKLFSTSSSKIHNFPGHFDFIIVGAGSAGAVLANRLSEISEWNILLLEAGGNLTKFSDIPGFCDFLQQSDLNWGYLSSPQTTCCQGMINHQCAYPRGKVIGGTSTLNGAVYARGSPSDYDEWVALGNPGWSFQEVLPYFKKSEFVELKSYDKPFHGTNGTLVVTQTHPPSAVAEAFLNANLQKGLKEVDYNGHTELGVSRIQFNVKDNIHQNSAHAFLDPVRSRKNLKIVLNASVNKILHKSFKRVKGVTFVKNGKIYKVEARKEVILSAGAINSPQLLLLSGIGPKDDLKKLKIPIRQNLPAVGKNLQDHPLFINLYFRTNASIPIYSLRETLLRLDQGMTPLTNGGGLEQLAFINVDNNATGNADIEFLTFPPPYVPGQRNNPFHFQEEVGKIYATYNTSTDIIVIMSLMKPKSKGAVTLKSNSILDFPLIDLNYFSDQNGEDLDKMIKGVEYILSLPETEAFKRINATYISIQQGCEHLKSNSKEYWTCAIRRFSSTEYHPCCTTRMGPTKKDSVVDTNCLVHTFRNLRVVDAGVMPSITRGHLNAAIYMIAEKISDVIKKQYKKI